MFFLRTFRMVVKITPNLFGKSRNESISNELDKKLANKVVINVGLCICLYDITHIGDSHIIPGDGSAHMKVTFRYVVFCPSKEETIEGKVKLCDNEGIHVSLTFFDDILIPPMHMQCPSKFNEVQSTWIWMYKVDQESDPVEMVVEKGDDIRFKVVDLEFNDTTPKPADQTGGAILDTSKDTPFRIIGKISESGLGLPSWWNQETEEGEEEEDAEMGEEAEDDEEDV
ncbi:DNA-directed RNA polymerase III subunit RPC8 [Neocloeon triangulifer]|uniref:DNA-directed RNA polymerase III subunit RPC8 n=1 Tax=Neocloeon triangulifer TaxID=2078957 RepID=UPI00286F0C47|nr:DNA-directed RNA polymerase III subunit RPC8 [Neocloeon triangulifer]XP_059477773.1 DNA-directed RNA polymerase III subunit RPC8 [Neocloeon triangulifer]XP_059477774.1 DNA-directed RNA polymerase III subunit RPC8 [Neocloeon triangulifer]XP_059477775.1 DNA-directed RNA polymerase III subunit RPC8 [Neocloeon triangulifer]XP_059477776.1 DNA-directed RNA polymerase III subunit RPC8 [Neocloeon triangulifer]XP_059477777.1 DNA-directed RNA polymerase III subunit RPC8 [Neocloeon triangulifer]